MNYFEFLETKFVERQKALAVSPADVTVENQARYNAVMSNIALGRRIVQNLYSVYLLAYFIAIKLRLVKPPTFQSSIPTQTPMPHADSLPIPSPSGPPASEIPESEEDA